MYKLIFLSLTTLLLQSNCHHVSENACFEVQKKYNISNGETFHFSLCSNPSTGYTWQWKSHDNTIVDSVSKMFQTEGTSMPGKGGRETWTFKANRSGNDSIKMYYLRPWDASSVDDSITVQVNVK